MTFNVEKIMAFCSGLWQMIGMNLVFLLFNLPAVFFLLFVGIDQVGNYLPFFLLCLLPAGPSLSALFYSVFRWRKEKDVRVWHTFWKAYRNNFVQSLSLAAIELFLIFMMAMNVRFFTMVFPMVWMRIFFQILLIFIIMLTPYFYLLAMRYELRIRDILKNAMVLSIGRPLLLLGNTAAFLFALVLYELAPGTVILFVSSGYAYLIIYMNQKIFSVMEE